MERRLRVLFKGKIYRVTIRGIKLRRWFGSVGSVVSQQIQRLPQHKAEVEDLKEWKRRQRRKLKRFEK